MVDLSNKKVLVTGGCGFIGSNFIEMILNKYYNLSVYNIDKMGIGSRSLQDIQYNHLNRYVEYRKDLRDISTVFHAENMVDFDYIFHFAAESHVDRSISGPKLFIDNNIMGMVELLEWARQHQKNVKIINISTDEVYGHLVNIDDPSFNESTPFAPRSPYSASKASADMIAASYTTTYGMDIITTHCCNNFGAHQADEKLIPTVIKCLIQNRAIPVYGNGQNIREWIHVDDHNKSILEIAELVTPHRRFNIGSNLEINNLDIIEVISKILKVTPTINFVEDRKGHDFRYSIESINYDRKFKLMDYEEAIKNTVEFYKNKYTLK
jgi:dTDP-glucose 4,6-dehydratase